MDLLIQIIAAIGGGMFGALIGGTNAFVLTGLTGIVGVSIMLAGGSDLFLNTIPAGALLGPHVAFGSGALAIALFKRLNPDSNVSGGDVFHPLYNEKPLVPLLVAGLTGAVSHFLFITFTQEWNLTVDNIALIIVISNLIARIGISKSELFPGLKQSDYLSKVHQHLGFNLITGTMIGFVSSYVSIQLNSNLLMFYLSAFSLIYVSFNRNVPATHHITLVSGYAAIQTGNLWLGVLFGVLAIIGFEYLNPAFNHEAESFMETSTVMIALLSFVIFTFF